MERDMPKLSEFKKSERKELIIDTAFDLFASKGYSATGLRDIMRDANISKGGIYVYFDSKLDILLAIVERMDAKRHNIKEEIDITDESEEKVSSYLRSRLKVFQTVESQKWSRILMEFWSLPKEQEELDIILEKRKNAYYSDIKDIIQHGIRIGVFRSNIQMDLIIYQIMCTINGAALLSSSFDNVISDEQIELAVEMHIFFLKERQ
jgi:AcrR family transcriptional regulator